MNNSNTVKTNYSEKDNTIEVMIDFAPEQVWETEIDSDGEHLAYGTSKRPMNRITINIPASDMDFVDKIFNSIKAAKP